MNNLHRLTIALLLSLLLLPTAFAQRMYDGSGRPIGRVDSERYYNASGQPIGRVDGERVPTAPDTVVIALNKPRGVVTAMSDDLGRPCVGDYVTERTERLLHRLIVAGGVGVRSPVVAMLLTKLK